MILPRHMITLLPSLNSTWLSEFVHSRKSGGVSWVVRQSPNYRYLVSGGRTYCAISEMFAYSVTWCRPQNFIILPQREKWKPGNEADPKSTRGQAIFTKLFIAIFPTHNHRWKASGWIKYQLANIGKYLYYIVRNGSKRLLQGVTKAQIWSTKFRLSAKMLLEKVV